MRLILHFDGSCVPNPGGKCAYGWHLDTEVSGLASGNRVAEGRGLVRDAMKTNNVGEWHGLIAGLEWIHTYLATCVDDRLEIRGDSRLVINTVNGDYRCKKPHLRKLSDKAKNLLRGIPARWTAAWIDREKNTRADALSVGVTELLHVVDFRKGAGRSEAPAMPIDRPAELARLRRLADELAAGLERLAKVA